MVYVKCYINQVERTSTNFPKSQLPIMFLAYEIKREGQVVHLGAIWQVEGYPAILHPIRSINPVGGTTAIARKAIAIPNSSYFLFSTACLYLH